MDKTTVVDKRKGVGEDPTDSTVPIVPSRPRRGGDLYDFTLSVRMADLDGARDRRLRDAAIMDAAVEDGTL